MCNSTTRQINVLGDLDPLGSWAGLAVPFRTYYEHINCTITGRVNANQSATDLVIAGMAGMNWQSCGNYVNNPLGLFVTFTALAWVQNCSSIFVPTPTWDFRNTALNTTNLAWTFSSFDGNDTQTAPPFYGAALDNGVVFSNNLLANYSTPSADGVGATTFIARECPFDVFVEQNTYEFFYGNALEVIGYGGAMVVFGNNFAGCGGSNSTPADRRWVAHLEPCADGLAGTITFQQNQQTTNISAIGDVVCDVPLWTFAYVDPVPWNAVSQYTVVDPAIDTKSFILANNAADGGLCVGLRLNNTTQKCNVRRLSFPPPPPPSPPRALG